jgi:hypothetical protein
MELVYIIFNDTASSCDCVASDGETINGGLIGRDVDGGGRGLILGSLLSRNLS